MSGLPAASVCASRVVRAKKRSPQSRSATGMRQAAQKSVQARRAHVHRQALQSWPWRQTHTIDKCECARQKRHEATHDTDKSQLLE
eukprot:7490730-Alexandrium_andersonii.AAC.1